MNQSQALVLKVLGLFTNANQLSEVPDGALLVAKNVNIDKDAVAESRRGLMRMLNAPASSLIRNDRVTSFQTKQVVHRSSDDTMAYYNGSGWTQYAGTYEHPDVDLAKMRFSQVNGNLYFTTSLGVKVLDAIAGPVYTTGMPRGLDATATTTGVSGFMADDTARAYRVVWGSRDANNNLYLGTPSQRFVVTNTSGGTRDVSVNSSIPDGITVNDFFQVYRSRASATASDEPTDELQLVYEKNPSSGEIAAKAFTFTDSTPDSLMGASLYTNSSQEGIAESNDQPPFAMDIHEFKNFSFFANVKTKQNISIKLLAAGGSGLALNDTITINSMVFTAKAAENSAVAQFELFTAGSAAQNIADTAQSLVRVINRYASNTSVYAYYLSGFQDLPGQILLQKRALDDVTFAVAVNKAAAWDIGVGTSSNDKYINGLMWGKNGQPEHVPTSHITYVGSKNFPIRRIIALRDSLFILKTDGIFRLTGSNGSWTVEPFDTSTRITAPDSASVVNNQIFSLCDQGVVAISDVGVQVMSRPIENLVQDLLSEDANKLKTLSFGVSYETDRKYILWTIASAVDSYPTQAFVYNTFTQAWTTWEKNAVHAFVSPDDDKIYLCNPEDKYLLEERKSLTATDYVDEEMDGFSVVSSSDLEVVLNTVNGLTVGDLLFSSSSLYSVILEIEASTNTVTVNEAKTWPVGAITVLKVIPCEIEFTYQHFKNPGLMKQFQEIAMFFREVNFIRGNISYYTDLSGGYSNNNFYGQFGIGPWGLFTWGSISWGGAARPKPIRDFVPREKSRGTTLSIRIQIANAYSKWSLNGISCFYEWISERTTRG